MHITRGDVLEEVGRKTTHSAVQSTNRCAKIPDTFEKKQLETEQKTRPLPAWMSLLPSNVNPHVKPPSQSILSQRMSFPSYSSSSNSTPYLTPLEWPSSHDDYTSIQSQTPSHLSLDGSAAARTSDEEEKHGSEDLSSLLQNTQDLFSLTKTGPSEVMPTQLRSFQVPTQPVTVSRPAVRSIMPITTYHSFQYSSLAHPYTIHNKDLRASRSEAHISSYDRAASEVTNPIPPESQQMPSCSTNPLPTKYGLSPRASSSEAYILNPYTKIDPSKKSQNPIRTSEKCKEKHFQQNISKHDPQQTPLPNSRNGPASTSNKPPFLKELSAFLASRTVGTKQILSSRAVRMNSPSIGIGLRVRHGFCHCIEKCDPKVGAQNAMTTR
jgi:hypothetical protein